MVLPPFGTFTLRARVARTVKTPGDNVKHHIPAHNKVFFQSWGGWER